jgi:MFS family permease
MKAADQSARSMFRSFRHRNFALFFSGQIISLVGTWMQSVAQSWLVYRLTQSSALLGMVVFASMIPSFVLAPFGGLVADRFDRRRILVTTQSLAMILALVLAGLTIGGVVRVWEIIVLATLLGIVNAFDIPTRQAFVVEIVGREDMSNAIALNSSMFNGARVVGPAVAGIVVAAIGEGWCFLLNGLSYIAVIIGLLLMKLAPLVRASERESALGRIAAGFRFVQTTTPIRALLLLLGAVSLTGMPYATLMPVFADSVLHGGAKGLGILMGFSGVGALAGSIALVTRSDVRGLGRWVAISSISFGASLIVFSMSKAFWLSAAILVAVGGAMMVQMASSNTLIQAMVPDALRGRVMAIYSMMFMGMAPFGALFAGSVASRIGAPITVAIGGGVSILAGVTFAVRLPHLRPAAARLLVENQMIGGDPVEETMAHEPLDEA